VTTRCGSVAVCVYLVGLLVWGGTDARRPKKFIATGWDKVDSARFLEHHAAMQERPFDGVMMGVFGEKPNGKTCGLRATFSAEKWEQDWFAPAVKRLQACTFTRFTDNFVTVGANPGNVDWFDDAGWANLVEHWRIAAWIAKQSGFKGLLFDPEPYRKPYAQFHYAAQAGRDAHSFAEYHAKARQRGRQVMKAVASEYLDLTIFCYFMNIYCVAATGRSDPKPILETLHYGLLPAFFDGWLDVVSPDVTLVDGCERAYMFNSTPQYLESAVAIKGACQELISPENRAKYRAQVEVSFGIYLDAYANPEGSKYFMDTELPSRLHQLRANLSDALRIADQYVWVYGEKYRWWPTPNGGVNAQSWPEALPGVEKALRYARDPLEYARAMVARGETAGTLVNLARNADFSKTAIEHEAPKKRPSDWVAGHPPAGWNAWQPPDSKGTFLWDRDTGAIAAGSARARQVSNGCFIQDYGVTSGERYVIRAACRVVGKGKTRIRVRWQTGEGKWIKEGQDQFIVPTASGSDWDEMIGVVEIPSEVGRMVILLGVFDQASTEDAAWFDDIEVYRME